MKSKLLNVLQPMPVAARCGDLESFRAGIFGGQRQASSSLMQCTWCGITQPMIGLFGVESGSETPGVSHIPHQASGVPAKEAGAVSKQAEGANRLSSGYCQPVELAASKAWREPVAGALSATFGKGKQLGKQRQEPPEACEAGPECPEESEAVKGQAELETPSSPPNVFDPQWWSNLVSKEARGATRLSSGSVSQLS